MCNIYHSKLNAGNIVMTKQLFYMPKLYSMNMLHAVNVCFSIIKTSQITVLCKV